MYVEMIETRSLKILLNSFHKNYSDLFKKQHGKIHASHWNSFLLFSICQWDAWHLFQGTSDGAKSFVVTGPLSWELRV